MANETKTANANQVRIGELYTHDTVAALNDALTERSIAPEQIISVLAVPGQGIGQPQPPRFRVLFRSN